MTVFCLLSIFTSPLLDPSLTPSVSTLSLLGSLPKYVSDKSNTHAATPESNSSSPLGCPCCRDPIIVRQTCRCCLGDPRPTILSYHPPHRVELFGDRQTPNVTALATHGRTRTSSPNALPAPLRRNLRLERLESSLSSLQPQVTDGIFYRNHHDSGGAVLDPASNIGGPISVFAYRRCSRCSLSSS